MKLASGSKGCHSSTYEHKLLMVDPMTMMRFDDGEEEGGGEEDEREDKEDDRRLGIPSFAKQHRPQK
jgi:hypothetical protein